jgi:predicted LPLAT superfamily acyltransferase
MDKKAGPGGLPGTKRETTEDAAHWSKQKEAAAGYWHVKLILIMFRFFPVIILRLVAFPVGFFYFLLSKRAREKSGQYLDRVAASLKAGAGRSGFRASRLSHILAFALSLVEKVESWGGKVSFRRIRFQDDDIGELIERLEGGKGAFLISSHLGNMEFIRGLAGLNRTGVSREIPVNAIVDFSVTAHFNRMLTELNPQSMTHLISAKETGPETVILLQERLAAGELVVIAGDRTSGSESSRSLPLPFFGEEAAFPYGPFFLASLLGVPVYFVFALRQKDISLFSPYVMHIHKSGVSFDCPRREREERIKELARRFVHRLEQYCKEHPCQWYNFYDFWGRNKGSPLRTVDGKNAAAPGAE